MSPLKFDPSISADDAAIRRQRFLDEMGKLEWFQRVHVEDGIITPGANDAHAILKRMGVPNDLRGYSVLDIGAVDGARSFECERRGADRVVALDIVDDRPTIHLVRDYLHSKVEVVKGTAYLLDPKKTGMFDYVLFCGLLDRCRYPALAVDRIRTVTRRTCFIESHVTTLEVRNSKGMGVPLTTFYEYDELKGDFANWTGPNIGQVMSWFRSGGFSVFPLDMQRDRATFRADVIPGTPPYLTYDNAQGEYSGMGLF